ncbi:cupin domain-containing protein [Streptomyces inhibens]|uniref:cupin domain-containing protein n=1 Tax=Streptomyces inhibens TaxID=2293571 RepID=UPI00369E7DCF
MDQPEFHEFENVRKEGEASGQRYVEFLRVPRMSAGVYVLATGAADPQQPHAEDELYIVIAGRATVWAGDESRPVGPGSIVYVPAEMPHRFTDITEDLRVAVVFSPPESRPTGSAS